MLQSPLSSIITSLESSSFHVPSHRRYINFNPLSSNISLPSAIMFGKTSAASALVATLAMLGTEATQAGVWQYWDYPNTSGKYNLDEFVTVSQNAPTRFFAHSVWFEGGDTAYIGFQNNPDGPLAIFSVWNATSAVEGSAGTHCQDFGGEGNGKSCRVAYPWSVGTTYRLRIWETDSRPDGSVQWLGAIQDTSTGVDTILGQLYSLPGQKLITSSCSWIEDYAMNANPPPDCAQQQAAAATFSVPTYNNNEGRASFGWTRTETCKTDGHQSTIQTSANGAYMHE